MQAHLLGPQRHVVANRHDEPAALARWCTSAGPPRVRGWSTNPDTCTENPGAGPPSTPPVTIYIDAGIRQQIAAAPARLLLIANNTSGTRTAAAVAVVLNANLTDCAFTPAALLRSLWVRRAAPGTPAAPLTHWSSSTRPAGHSSTRQTLAPCTP
jgi:hypothetical protein